jgi:transposase InsO family protein
VPGPGHRPLELLSLEGDRRCPRCPQVPDERTTARIQTAHAASDGTYGVPRITAELRESGERVNHKKVARLMKYAGLAGLRLRRPRRTTVADPAAVKAPDLLRRAFTASQVNTKDVGDITYLPVCGGKFCYLATVIDLASRRPAGRAIADHMRADLVLDAVNAAEQTRGSLAGAVMHTDHGAQLGSARRSHGARTGRRSRRRPPARGRRPPARRCC